MNELSGLSIIDKQEYRLASWAISENEYNKHISWQSSHPAIEGLLVRALASSGWLEIPTRKTKYTKGLHVPDRIFLRDKKRLLIEVKPGTAKLTEIKKGLGQVLCLLADNDGIPVLVCSIEWKECLVRALRPLEEAIWLLLFTEDKQFVPIIGNFLKEK